MGVIDEKLILEAFQSRLKRMSASGDKVDAITYFLDLESQMLGCRV
jgi:hypothetical protein